MTVGPATVAVLVALVAALVILVVGFAVRTVGRRDREQARRVVDVVEPTRIFDPQKDPHP